VARSPLFGGIRVYAASVLQTVVAGHVLDLDAGQPMGHFVRGISLELLGDVSGAIRAFERAAFSSGSMPLMVGFLAAALAAAGRKDEARTLRAQLVDL